MWKLALLSRWENLLRGWHLTTAGWLLLPLLAGMAGGLWASQFVSTARMKRIMCGFLFVPGTLLLLQ